MEYNHEDDHFKLLARINERIFITHCQHGTLHLNWGIVTIHMRPKDFLHVAQLQEQGSICFEKKEIVNGPIKLAHSENGDFELTILDFVLKMNAIDYLRFVEMVRKALKKLGYEMKEISRPLPPIKTHEKYKLTRSLFSLN
jgi:hypothetical protein